jgi:3-hydroxyacyl-[acyl-carrier-protein] dehydratase
MDVQEIAEILPHRYPMLMVDRILEINKDSIVGLKNVTINEPHFTGHFPGYPVMPGVMIIEAMAQVGGILIAKIAPHTRGRIMFLASVEEAKFRKPVVPGDQLRIRMELIRLKHTIAKMKGEATVDGQVAAEATLMCKLTDQLSAHQPGHDALADQPATKQSTREVTEPQLA